MPCTYVIENYILYHDVITDLIDRNSVQRDRYTLIIQCTSFKDRYWKRKPHKSCLIATNISLLSMQYTKT